MNPHRYCVIMCGGIGSRFWPYSRTAMPKQFLDFLGTGRSLLQMSYDRILPVVPPENIIVVTNAMYAETVREQLPDIRPENILLEPARRNTAPCIAWAAYHIAATDPQASMIVTPSDHLILREADFTRTIEQGMQFVEAGDTLLTIGITPTRPETGYGYIQVGERVTDCINRVKTFTEKPDLELARVFVASGEFFWNSGIFLWRADSIKRALQQHAPDIAMLMDRGTEYFGTQKELEFIDRTFESCPGISIDYAVMEKAKNVYVERADFGWSDLGTWSALYDNSPKNRDSNVTQRCTVMAYDSTGNIFASRSGDKLIVVDGLKDYIVADTDDVLLICPKAREQSIKQMVNDVKVNFPDGRYL